ncbi:hypothetical protein DX130_16335 [Paenibacillus paeoniae]|uniref:Uncharacterized protein n=2 Tax=Paenibacillus paeoniae TaxID=2292705 RepID=A0A371PHC8_9BACL|nr:hypothetical protein DX130_16335 [Paenibacillus paeoniae]
MSHPDKAIATKWIDDYLDLYNLAVSIGDTAWQQDILQSLRDRDSHIRAEIAHNVQVELWLRFDSINRKMLDLYEQLRSSANTDNEKRQLQEQVWEFKIQRVTISNKLKAQYTAQQL